MTALSFGGILRVTIAETTPPVLIPARERSGRLCGHSFGHCALMTSRVGFEQRAVKMTVRIASSSGRCWNCLRVRNDYPRPC
jgi:hypothetical protein